MFSVLSRSVGLLFLQHTLQLNMLIHKKTPTWLGSMNALTVQIMCNDISEDKSSHGAEPQWLEVDHGNVYIPAGEGWGAMTCQFIACSEVKAYSELVN